MALTETAFAKLNLALHVRGRREDGYHEIETLFAFVDEGDRLTASPASRDVVNVTGDFAGELDDPFGNIVAKTLTSFRHVPGWSVILEKRLPVAAGLGGGSADAAAVIRMIERWGGLPDDWRERAAKLGADVPACVASVTCIGKGTGTDLMPVDSDLAGTPTLMVNPRVPLSTAAVYAAWNGGDGGPLPSGSAREIMLAGRNDLEAPAIALCPPVAEVLDCLRTYDPLVARMSGSGASCFALFAEHDALLDAMERLRFARPDWWMCGGLLR